MLLVVTDATIPGQMTRFDGLAGTFRCWRDPKTVRQALRRSCSRHTVERLSIFHHFPITGCFVVCKCRQFSVLGFTRGSLGSSNSATELRPLVVPNCTQELVFGTAFE
jgi:hypothetical protein